MAGVEADDGDDGNYNVMFDQVHYPVGSSTKTARPFQILLDTGGTLKTFKGRELVLFVCCVCLSGG